MIRNQDFSLDMYCLCMDNKIINKVTELNYIPVGLGKKKFNKNWTQDNTGINISNKNKYYGEYTFHYWLWKNKLNNYDKDKWIGFCTYRRHWAAKNYLNKNDFKNNVLKSIPEEWENYDVILGKKVKVTGLKLMKVLKRGKKLLIKNPKLLFKKNRNIKFQFDFNHGNGVLDKAIDLLDAENKNDFRKFVDENDSYNEGNMFITKSKFLMDKYYGIIFSWLEKCEKIFGFDLEGYSKIRIYAFLAERFLPYWFNKNAKILEWPIIFHDLRNKK